MVVYRAKLYMVSTTGRGGRQYPEFQGSTVELTEDDLKDLEKTKQRLIDDFVDHQRGIFMQMKYKGQLVMPKGLQNRKWRDKIISKMEFEFPESEEEKERESDRGAGKDLFFLTSEMVEKIKKRTVKLKKSKMIHHFKDTGIKLFSMFVKKVHKYAVIVARDSKGRFTKVPKGVIKKSK